MKVSKVIIKIIVLVAVFFLSLILFAQVMGQTKENLMVEMEEASLPIVSVYYKNNRVACLHGYTKAPAFTSMRENLTPVTSEREITVAIEKYGEKVESFGYEIRSLDGERLIAERTIEDFTESKSKIKAKIVLENLLDFDKEYQLVFNVKLEGREGIVKYFTRVTNTTILNIDEYIGLVGEFYDKSIDKKKAGDLSLYMETDSSVPNKNLNFIDIHASIDQLSFADSGLSYYGENVITVSELNPTFAVLLNEYVMTGKGEDGELEYFNVKEYFRMSYNESGKRCYLHDFERKINQIFKCDEDVFEDDYVKFGISDKDVKYKKNESETITCFVREGELFCINEGRKMIQKIFGFRGLEGIDPRENFDNHEIEIFSVDGDGSIDFSVMGYMNRGLHEGEVGISIMHFDSASLTTEEVLYIPTDKTAGRLLADTDSVLYENSKGIVFLKYDDVIYRINTENYEVEVLAENLSSDACFANLDFGVLIWQQNSDKAKEITVLNLEDETKRLIPLGENNEKLYPIGFLQDDFIYGVANSSGLQMADGYVPMRKIVVYNPLEGKILKEYSKDNYFVYSVEIDNYIITLHRVLKSGNTYKYADDDYVMNSAGEGILDASIITTFSEVKQTETNLKLDAYLKEETFNYVTTKEIINEAENVIDLEENNARESFYVYAKGRDQKCFSNLSDAIVMSDNEKGVVVDETLNYVWERARRSYVNSIAIPENTCENAKEIIEEFFAYDKSYKLDGVGILRVLYYVSKGIPVVVKNGDAGFLITGYDASNVTIYDVKNKNTSTQSIEDISKKFASMGDKYIVYISW